MLRIKRHGPILRTTSREWENLSVFNPGVYQDGDDVHILYRALDKNYMSTFGYARLKGPTEVVERSKLPVYTPKYSYESKGIEDPRITKIGDTFYVTYVAHNGRDAVIAYMYGKNLLKLRRGGIISTIFSYKRASHLFQYSHLKDKYSFMASFYEKYADPNVIVWEKDGVLFPEKIRGKLAMLHRILPDIQVARFGNFQELKDPNYWHDHIQHLHKHVVLEGDHGWEARHVGAGAPPLKTKKGWLLIYHGVEPKNRGRIYRAGAALLDLKYPTKVIARLPDPLFVPIKKGERYGHVHNVVFPTGLTQFDDRLYIYYGSADSRTSVVSVNYKKLMSELLRNKVK